MKRLLATAIVLCAASAAAGQTAPVQQRPHPAVVRVIAPEQGGVSYGSGALVAVNDSHGLVVTNWHVIRDATGPPVVVFPDGFRSAARVLKVDRDWDLAALAIWRPEVQPIVLAADAPRPGEVLTIAGYGPVGWYRAAAGRCVQYVSPGRGLPFEMVELSTAAREGDSGGPIFNQRGELSGVLFGSGFGSTMGSYCGRVRRFLTPVLDDFQRLPPQPAIIARRPAGRAPETVRQPRPESLPAGSIVGGPRTVDTNDTHQRPPAGRELVELPALQRPERPAADVFLPADTPNAPPPALPTRAEQIKTILAAIGILFLLFHGIRLMGAAAR